MHRASSAAGSAASRRAVAGSGPDAAARRRPAPGQQRRRRQQLRDARARQADPHVRRGGRPRRPDHRPPGPRGRADRDARPRRSASSRPDTLLIADPAGPLGIAGVMGGADLGDLRRRRRTSSSSRPSSTRSASAGRPSATPSGPRRACGSRRARSTGWRELGADRTARLITEWAGGQVAVGAVDTNPTEPPPTRVAFRPARVDRLLGTDVTATGAARPCWRGSAWPRSRAPRGTRVLVATAPQPLEVDRWRGGGRAGDRPDLAARPGHRGGHRRGSRAGPRLRARSPSILPHTPMPPYRHSPLRLRDTVRETLAGAGLSEAVTFALVVAGHGRAVPARSSDIVVPGEGEAGGRPVTVTNPLSSQHSVMRQSLIGSLLEVVATNVRQGRQDVAIFEIGKGYGATEDGDSTHEWWRLGFALTGAGRGPAWNRPARPYDLDDAKGIIELIAARLGLPRPDYAPLDRRPEAASGPGGPRPGRRRARGPCRRAAPGRRRGARPAGRLAHPRRRARHRRPVRRPAERAPRRRRLSRHPAVDRDLAVDRRGATPPPPTSRPPSAATPARCCAPWPCSTSTAAVRWRDEREVPRVPPGVPGRRPDAGRDRGRRRRGDGHRGPGRGRRGSPPDLTRKYLSDAVASRSLRPAKSRCYPCAAPGRMTRACTVTQGGSVDLGTFFGSIQTVDLLLALFFMGFFVLGFAQGTIRRLIGIGSILVLVPARRQSG